MSISIHLPTGRTGWTAIHAIKAIIYSQVEPEIAPVLAFNKRKVFDRRTHRVRYHQSKHAGITEGKGHGEGVTSKKKMKTVTLSDVALVRLRSCRLEICNNTVLRA